ncbi:MAG: hypothetical protein QM813_27785 [Verrucomicrobiota bacterium]
MLCALTLMFTVVLTVYLFRSPVVVAVAALFITSAIIGVHSLMSGTAAADFGGRKATATCSGIVDGFVYLGTGIQALCIGFLTPQDHAPTVGEKAATTFFSFSELAGRSWFWWPVFLVPFALLGMIIAWIIWHELPAATKKYLAQQEKQANEPGSR